MELINILNWEKYNPRTDRTGSSWLRLENNFFEEGKFSELNCQERLFWIYLLCCQSKNRGKEFILNMSTASLVVDKKNIDKYLLRLKCLGVIVVTKWLPSGDTLVTSGSPTDGRYERTGDVLPDGNTSPSICFDQIYQEYPRRVGNQRKALGMKSLRKLIHDPDSFENILAAVRRYAAACRKAGTYGTEKVAMFSTFFGRDEIWREWLNGQDNENHGGLKINIASEGKGY